MVSHRSLSRNGQHCGRTLPQHQSPTGLHRQKAPQCEDRHLFSAATVIRSRQSFRPDRCGLLRPRAEAQFPASRPCDHPPGAIPNRTGQRPRCPQPQPEAAQTAQNQTIRKPTRLHHQRFIIHGVLLQLISTAPLVFNKYCTLSFPWRQTHVWF